MLEQINCSDSTFFFFCKKSTLLLFDGSQLIQDFQKLEELCPFLLIVIAWP